MTSQHSHSTTPFVPKQFPIVVVCDTIESPANIGALFRTCDAFGVQEIIFCGSKIDFSSSRLKRTARTTNEKIEFSCKTDIYEELTRLKKVGYELIALEISEKSIPISKLNCNASKIALVLGNEKNGISEDILKSVSQIVHIEMYGKNSSMNVVQAAGIALYSLTNKLK